MWRESDFEHLSPAARRLVERRHDERRVRRADQSAPELDTPPAPQPGEGSAEDWNRWLAKTGHRVGEPFLTVSDPDSPAGELDDLRFPPRERTASPVLIRHLDGTVDYANLGSDLRAIRAFMDDDGNLDELMRAGLGRGRPGPDKAAAREELAQRVRCSANAGATIGALADVLGCGRKAASELAGRKGTVPTRARKTPHTATRNK
jgi:hypothetical protein